MNLAKQPNDRMLSQSVSWSSKQVHYTADNSHRTAHISATFGGLMIAKLQTSASQCPSPM
jgi:hypothetical protein